MIRYLLLTICLISPVLAQTEPELSAAITAAKDDVAARKLLAQAYDRGQGQVVVATLAQGDRMQRYLNWREGPTADPLTAAILQEPHCIRLLAGRLAAEDPQLRLAAARLARWSNWPYLIQILMEQTLVEQNADVQVALFDAFRGALKEDELRVAWQTKSLSPPAEAARLRALFRLGLARAGLTHRVAAWPGGPDWTERGFAADRSVHPFRKLLKSSVELPKTQNREAALYLLGYAMAPATPPITAAKMTVTDGDHSLGTFDLMASPEVAGLRLISWQGDAAPSATSEFFNLQFAETEGWEAWRFRALVGFERTLTAVGPAFFTKRLLPGPGLEIEGGEPDEELRPGLVLDGDRARFVIEGLDQKRKIHSFELDHWSEDKGGSVWELALNGQVVVQLIGQPRPRAAKSSLRNFKLEKGKNVVELRRLSGQTLHVESLRLRFE